MSTAPLIQCIYCQENKPATEFNREHVVPEGFGGFLDAPVLHKTVCKACNKHFGDTLDLTLNRDSLEGLDRFDQRVKRVDEISHFRGRKVTLRAADDAGEYAGAALHLVPSPDGTEILSQIAASAAFRLKGSEKFKHVSMDDVLSGTWNDGTVAWEMGLKLFGGDAEREAMRVALVAQGVVAEYRDLETPEAPSVVVIEAQSEELRRAVAKIAFNYLAFRLGRDFALLPAFDTIRRYVRWGELADPAPVVTADDTPFDRADGMRPIIHHVSLETHREHRNLLGTVMLFGFRHHVVILALDFDGPWPELPLGHIYTLKNRKAQDMPPPRRWRQPDRAPSGDLT